MRKQIWKTHKKISLNVNYISIKLERKKKLGLKLLAAYLVNALQQHCPTELSRTMKYYSLFVLPSS